MYKITVNVEGMMCENCEAHVNKAVSRNFDVKSVTSSHESGKTEIISENPVDEAKLKEIISEEGYTVTAVKTES